MNFFCVGAPLAINMGAIMSPFGLSIGLVMIMFHLSGFIIGHKLTGIVFHNAPDVEPLQRTLSFETGSYAYLITIPLAKT